jgi:hypothetical protein
MRSEIIVVVDRRGSVSLCSSKSQKIPAEQSEMSRNGGMDPYAVRFQPGVRAVQEANHRCQKRREKQESKMADEPSFGP